MFGMVFARNRKDLTAPSQQPTLGKIGHRTFSKKHSCCGDKQKCAEQVKDEMKALHERDTAQDHRAAHDQCTDNSPNQNATLCERRNAKMREYQNKNKNVIHA